MLCVQEEVDGCTHALSVSLRKLLAMAASRCALVLRKVDVRPANGDCTECRAAEGQLLALLQEMWRGVKPKVRPCKRVPILDKWALLQQQREQLEEEEEEVGMV